MPTLHWLNAEDARRAAQAVPYRLLEADPALSYGDPLAQNLLIQGDNLGALKSLLPYYAGQVKCMFIDPPYNTGSAFEHYDDSLEHSTWLNMMYPRLELLREFLSEDGSIWVSIDDREGHYLKVIMDEVMGRQNFVTTFIWQKVDSPNDNKVPITPDHEFILCYAGNLEFADFHKKSDYGLLDAYPNTDDLGRKYRDRLLKKNGKHSLRTDRPSMFFPIPSPDGTDVYPMHDDGREACWAFGKERVFEMLNEGLIVWKERLFNNRSAWVPYTREYAPDNPTRPNPPILLDVNTSRPAKAHQRQVLPNVEAFDTVKPEELIERIFDIATNPCDLVLDSFLGSGTTAAVAHKRGRRYIGIELGEHAVTHCVPRLKKVVDGEQGGISQAGGWQGGGGFRFYRLGEPVFDETNRIHPGVTFRALAAHVWFVETKTPYPGAFEEDAAKTPFEKTLLGVQEGRAYYLLYNGILGDKRPEGGNVLTHRLLRQLPSHDGPRTIYGEVSLIEEPDLRREGITFKKIPYEIQAR
jgi:adenine-specific DNA-methyltransferase